jgi:hypothetical protein
LVLILIRRKLLVAEKREVGSIDFFDGKVDEGASIQGASCWARTRICERDSLGFFAFIAITGYYVLWICSKSKYGAWNKIEILTLLIQFRSFGHVFANNTRIFLS